MYCKKCGVEIPNGVNYCKSCGAEAGKNKKKVTIPVIIGIVVAVVIILALIGNSNPIKIVKNGTFNNYPEQTVGNAFESFFVNPEWSSYKENGDTYVKFTGKCTLYDELVNAKIIFLIDGKSFVVDSCIIGDINVTSEYDMESVLDKIYAR